jgi:hypothetical protein
MKKSRFDLAVSIFQIIVGTAAIVAYIFIALGGENVFKWSITLLLAIFFIVIGTIGIFRYIGEKKQ